MKNLKRLSVIAILIAIVSFQTQAQVRFGPTVGANFSTMTLKSSGISIDPSSLIGLQAGILAEISFGNFAVQPAFLYSMKGSKYKISSLDLDIKMTPSYIEIPINAVYKIGAGPINVMLLAGPYFAYGIGGKYSVKSATESVDQAIKFGSGQDNDLKPLDIGLNLGAGIEISHFQLQAQYGIGLLNLAPVTDNGAEQKNKGVTISLAYLFGSK